mmetsp:Transcript_16362/g.35356  ORF Transcript_16362/g.35356 Transcript_16362/m.35356 type:complete len:272 (+) Transcript_16362:39-854(+)
MTLPPFMTSRAALANDHHKLLSLEANVALILAHKFTPSLFYSILAEDGLMDIGTIELPDDCPLMNTTNTCMVTNKRPFIPEQAADIVDAALEDFRMVTPPLTPEPERPAKKARNARRSASKTRSSSSLPTADDPIDESFRMKLYSKRDIGRINPAHVVIRRDVLEVRRYVSGKILFQCACCKHLPSGERAKLSTLATQSVENIYRAIGRFIKHHVPACEHISQEIKLLSPKTTKVGTQRETKQYWVKSAMRLGLVDGEDGKSIVFCHPAKN